MKTILKGMVALSLVSSALFGADETPNTDIYDSKNKVDCEAYLKKEEAYLKEEGVSSNINININIKETCDFFNKKFEQVKEKNSTDSREYTYNKLLDAYERYIHYNGDVKQLTALDIVDLSKYNLISKEETDKLMLSSCMDLLMEMLDNEKDLPKSPKEMCDIWYAQKITIRDKALMLVDYGRAYGFGHNPSLETKAELIKVFQIEGSSKSPEETYKRLKAIGWVK